MVKFLSKFRRGGDDETDAQPPPAAPSPVAGEQEGGFQEQGIAPDYPTESSFMESSIDAEPVDVPVTKETKKEKSSKLFSAKVPRFGKRSEKEPKEPRAVVPSFERPYDSSMDADPVDVPVTQPPPTKEVKKEKGSKFSTKVSRFRKRSEEKEPKASAPSYSFDKPVEYRSKSNEQLSEARQEQIAMDTFQYRIHQSRASGYSQYGQVRAPGFDYLNWRPYGYPRYPRSNPESYLQQVHALVPYVYDVVVSGCQGVEERRWDALTKSADEHAEYAEASRDVSRLGSRTQSRDRLMDI